MINEAYRIFSEFRNKRQMGICLSNIGSLKIQMEQYQDAVDAYDKASQIIKEELEQ